MKKITLLILLLFVCIYANSQTALTAGDIAFVGTNTDGATNADDNVSFVLLKDIDAATTIIFTDMGWNDTTGFFATAGDGEFTWTSGVSRSAGQVVTVDMGALFPAAYSIIGDQIFALQGSTASPIFIAGLQFNDTSGDDANWDGSAISNSTSALPNALVTGLTAVRLIPEQDNWQFSCALAGGPVSGTPAQIRALVNNRANWVGNDNTVYSPVIPAGCTFTVTAGGDTVPPVITCASTPTPITAGINGMASIPDLVTGTTATDNVSLPGNITITQSPTAGTMVGAGVNTVTLTATDEAGNSASCTIDVTVNEPPFTTLGPGDIAFVGYNVDGNDSFAFIILKDIIAGTNIKFTDCGVSNPNSITCVGAGGEGSATWYAPSAMSAGDIVTLPGSFITGSVISITGDQIFAYQGTAAAPIFITGIHANLEAGTNDADWDGGNTTNATSALPDQLANGVNAIRVYAAGPTEIDNWQFDCTLVPGGPTITGTAVEISAIINDIQYWVSNDISEYVPAAKSGCIYNVLPPDTTPPTAVCQNITVQLDGTGSVTILAADVDGGSTDNVAIVSYAIDIDTFNCSNVGTPVTVTLTVTDAAGNTDTCEATVTVEDNVDPTAVCQNITVQLDATGNATITAADVDGGSTDNCAIDTLEIDIDTFDCSNIGANNVVLTITDVNGNTSTCTAIVTVEDTVDPIANCAAPFTVQLDAAGNASITVADIENGSTDACGIASTTIDITDFDCSDIGPNTVTLTVTDVNGNTATCTTVVTVEDTVDPIATCQDITVALDAFGDASILASDINNGSTDNCSILSVSVSPNTFTCDDIGANTVTLTVTDVNGNVNICTATVTITDPLSVCNQPPVAVCQPLTVNADGSCQGNAVAEDFDGGSTDPDGDTLTFSVNPAGPYPVGVTTVILTVSDGILTDSCTTTITVVDSTAPTANCAAPFTIQLDASGNASITVADIENGSTDNCGIATTTIDIDTFDCSNVGANTVTLTVTDVNGNTSTCSTVVTVEDNVAPTAVCQNITVQLDANGTVTITGADVDGGSTDACGIDTLSIDIDTFDCSNVGDNNVLLTVTDANGNVSTCTAIVTVEDNVDPTAVCQNITIELDANGNASITTADVDGGSTDNCGVDTIEFTQTLTAFAEVNEGGALTITLPVGNVVEAVVFASYGTPNGSNGNYTIGGCHAANSQSIVEGYALGNNTFTIPADNGLFGDPCGGTPKRLYVTVSYTSVNNTVDFTCSNVGNNTVTLLVTDVNGNTATCNAIVTVEDNIAPVITCVADATRDTDLGVCQYTVVGTEFDATFTDNCNSGTISNDLNGTATLAGEVLPKGTTTIVWTVDDGNGQTATCTTVITVEDNEAPIVSCVANSIRDTDPGVCEYTVIGTEFDATFTDNCADGSITNDYNGTDTLAGEVLPLGDTTVIWTVNDGNGQTATCTTIITIEDNEAPLIFCPAAITANTDAGECFGTVNFSLPIALDNCGIDTVVQTAGLPSGSQFPVGTTTIEFTATDVNGNGSTCSFTVTIIDNEVPVAVCQNITIQLDANGNATITAADVDGGSTDQCGIASTTIDIDTFDCSNVGDNNVVLTVTDVNGNVSTCTAIVTVEDVTAPVVACQNITIELDPITGTATILGTDIDNGSTDACGIASYELDIDTFDCSNVGDNTVVLTVTDVNGNVATCTAIVTVEDNTAPVLVCQDFTLELGADGTATLQPGDVIASNEDACGILTTAVDITQFSCADIGTPVTVQVFSQDSNGNLATCTAIVTVVDNLAPVVTCPADQTVDPGAGNLFYIVPDYFATGEATAEDNCTNPLTIMTQSPAPGSALADGVYTVTLTATDEYGNTGTCSFELTVDSVLGTGDQSQNLGTVTLYPVPTKNVLNIGNPKNIDLERIEIYDLRGRLVKSSDLRGMGTLKTIDVDQLEAATYMVKIIGSKGEITKRLLKE